jgi:glutamyl-Q tRNA(Asp) synthetase
LHFGSLVAALGSYLDARARGGLWRVRIEDVDRPRTLAGAADDILRTLEAFGFEWDGAVWWQSQREDAYAAALEALRRAGAAYPCACTRREIADSSLAGVEGPVYPGTCRGGLPAGRGARAFRVRVEADSVIAFEDRAQGWQSQDVARVVGDFVVRRADGLFAYQLAVVVDDAAQGVSDVVRGADLLASTPRQIHLQRLLGLPQPRYLHLPVALDAAGNKLGKQTRAPALEKRAAAPTLCRALGFLGQEVPPEVERGAPGEILAWAAAHWEPRRFSGVRQRPVGFPGV